MDVEKILHKLESMNMIRLHKITGDYYQIYCPIHNDGNERHPSCGVLLHTIYKGDVKYPAGFTHCFSCNYAKTLPELISDLLKKHNINQTGLDWLRENIPGFDPDVESELLIPTDISVSIENSIDSAIHILRRKAFNTIEYVTEEELQSYRYTVPYMYERKMTDEAIEVFDVGFDPNFIPPGRKKPVPCITIPVRDMYKNTLFLCRRSIKGKFFFYPQGVTKPVFGIDLIPKDCKSVIIVESCINAITCYVYGYTAVALLGTGDSYQMKQLKSLGIREFVICMDPDPAGEQGVKKLKKNLNSVAVLWTMHLPDGKDVNDIDKSTFDRLYMEKD